eukprot:6315729-Pyramimonas_sp.AAC.1
MGTPQRIVPQHARRPSGVGGAAPRAMSDSSPSRDCLLAGSARGLRRGVDTAEGDGAAARVDN